jgi:two-component system sensor histidine kinase AlgZ
MPRARQIGVVVLVNTAGGVVPAGLAYLFNPEGTLAGLLGHLEFSLVYSFCIGTLAFAVMPRLAPRLFRKGRYFGYAAFWLTLASLAVAGSLLSNVIFLYARLITPGDFWIEFRSSVRVAIAITLTIGTLVAVFEGLSHRLRAASMELRDRQQAEERARQAATEARLSSLESRIHPHFLFNTLNSISALIREDPGRAERTVERLAALLRYSLDTNTRGLVPLRQELRIVEDYLEIEKTRFGERLRYTIEVQPGIEELETPPLALQTLVENSIKHAISTSRQGGEIRVSACLDAGRLRLEVSDDGPGFDYRSVRAGHGLDNLQERLAALFHGQGSLEVGRQGARTLVSIAIPQNRVLV